MHKHILALLLVGLFFTACKKDDGEQISFPDGEVSRTVLVYMVADNNLSTIAYSNIDNMVGAASAANMRGGRIIAFHDRAGGLKPQLIEISAGADGRGQQKVIKEYGQLNSADPAVFISIVADMQRYAPADSYGLIMWGHGTGWMPAQMHDKYARADMIRQYSEIVDHNYIRDPFDQTRAFGDEAANLMETNTRTRVLPYEIDQRHVHHLFDQTGAFGEEAANLMETNTRTRVLPYEIDQRHIRHPFDQTRAFGDAGQLNRTGDEKFSLDLPDMFGQIYFSDVFAGTRALGDEAGSLMDVQTNQKYIRDTFAVARTRAFGDDGKKWMNLDELSRVFPAGVFDFVIFDVCFMGSAEVVYPFRNKTKYIVASPAEVLAEGLPYDRIVPFLFADQPALGRSGIAEIYFNYYNSYVLRAATTAVYDCSQMDRLATVMRSILTGREQDMAAFQISGLQFYDRSRYHSMFDIVDTVEKLGGVDAALVNELKSIMSALVVYKATTEYFLSFPIDLARYSGLSLYIPLEAYSDLNEHYRNTIWYRELFL